VDFVGQGELPAEFDRVNWDAALFSLIWVWIYGLKPWIIGLTALFLAPVLIENVVILFVSAQALPQAMAVLDPISMVVWSVVIVVFGLRANRVVWEHERRRFASALGEPARPIPLWRYRKSTRFWTRLALGLIVLGFIGDVVLLIVQPELRAHMLTSWPGSWIPLTVLFVLDRIGVGRRMPRS
jgi:hypothetical protein